MIISISINNKTIVHQRDEFILSIKDNACIIIIAHKTRPGVLISVYDKDITTRLCQVGENVGISDLGHVIISKNSYYSFSEFL